MDAKYCNECVCLSVRSHISKTTRPNVMKFSVYVLPAAVARSSSDDSAVRYVLPVVWMTSCLPVISQAKVTSPGRVLKVTQQGAEPWAKCDVYDRSVPGCVNVLSFIQCFDTVGWVDRKDIRPVDILCHFSAEDPFWNRWRKKT